MEVVERTIRDASCSLHAQENGAWTNNLDRLGPRHYQITLLDPIF